MKKIKLIIILTLLFSVVFISAVSSQEYAKADCGGVETSIIDCTTAPGTGVKSSAIWSLLKIAIGIMTGGIVIAAVGGMIYGSILFTASGSNPESRKKSITIFSNIAIGVISYALMWALLNFIVPGGISF